MNAGSADGGRWVTPPPMDDGSAVWSGDGYSAVTESDNEYGGFFGFADYSDPREYADRAGYADTSSGSAGPTSGLAAGYAAGRPRSYVPGGPSTYGGSYPYYLNIDPSAPAPPLPPYWPPPPGVAPATDAFATTSLVLGILGFVPVAAIGSIVFGILSLRRITRRPLRGRGLAIAGMLLSVVWLVALVLVLTLTSVGRQNAAIRNSAGVITHRGTVNAGSLRVGDCVQLPTEVTTIDAVAVMPCSTPHNSQVFTTSQVTDASYPGEAQLDQEGIAYCQSQMTAFIGGRSTALHVVAIVPNEAGWSSGKRFRNCLAVDRQEQVTGDIRATASIPS